MTTSTAMAEAKRHWLKRRKLRSGALVVSALLLTGLGGWTSRTPAPTESAAADTAALRGVALHTELAAVRDRMAVIERQLDRSKAVIDYSTKYQIPADLSAAIYDIARAEGIDPRLAYRLVKVESNFKADARSGAGAIGYTQLQVPTARYFQPGVTVQQLMQRDVNLRLGLRFLRTLMVQYHNDMHLALLAYNRGPARVNEILAAGGDPRNGYAKLVLKGYRPPELAQNTR